MPTTRSTPAGRLPAIDQFRGFAILLMVPADFLARVVTVPPWLKHATDIGYTVIDLIAPLFIFAIGLTFRLSFHRRLSRDGAWRTYEHFIARNLALLGLGYLLTLGGDITGLYPSTLNWGVLQALGAAGLLALVVIRMPPGWRAVVAIALLAVYQILLDRFWLASVLGAIHNGPWGALSWSAMLILAIGVGDFYHDAERGRATFPWLAALLIGAGLALSLLIPLSKNRATASYVLLSAGLSALIFWGFHLLNERTRIQLPVLGDWGKNSLLLYLLHGILIGAFVVLPPALYALAPAWLTVLELAALLAALSYIGWFLNRRGLYFGL